MELQQIIDHSGMSRYKVAKESGLPQTTVTDLCTGKTSLKKASAETVYKLARTLGTTVESLLSNEINKETGRPLDPSYLECGLPSFLQASLQEMIQSWETIDAGGKDSLWDCKWCDLNSDINVAEVEQMITSDQANHLREKYLRMEREEI